MILDLEIFFSIGKRWLIYAGCKEKQVEGKCSRRKFYQNMLQAAMVESTQPFLLWLDSGVDNKI